MAQLAIVLVIVLLIFGTKRLRQAGGDIGGMFKGIKDGFKEARAASDELAPEVRAAIDDVKQLHAHGKSFVQDPLSRGGRGYYPMGAYGHDHVGDDDSDGY